MSPVRVMIASPLEPEYVELIRAHMPASVELFYEPSLYPPTRYIADHHGSSDFRRSPEQERRWLDYAAIADVAFDFPLSDQHPADFAPNAKVPEVAGQAFPHPASYAPNLKWVQTTSSGVGQMVARMGIKPGELIVTTASGVHARPLTEFVFYVLLAAMKEGPRLIDEQRRHHWERYCGDELSGKTLAIVGPGKIGREIARIARAFEMTPVAMGRDNRPERAAELGVDRLYARADLHEMLSAADAVVLCAPHTPETENILDRAAFAALKPGVVFINIGRGPLVDEAALLDKLNDGTIRLAGLDVFRTEPLPAGSPFWDLPNVIVSPHSASTSVRENERIVDLFIHNLNCFVAGRYGEMRNVLDIEKMY